MQMKRDMDLLREILIEVEKLSVNHHWTARPLLGFTLPEVIYHIERAKEGGLLEARTSLAAGHAVVLNLTNEGHNFVEAARSETVWETAKEMATKATGTPTLQAVALAIPKAIERLLNP
jgi:hypothetical protein